MRVYNYCIHKPEQTMIVVNQQVTLNNCLPPNWFKKGFPLLLTGKVTKVFKNGNFAVSVNELPNRSDDGKRTMHFSAEDLA